MMVKRGTTHHPHSADASPRSCTPRSSRRIRPVLTAVSDDAKRLGAVASSRAPHVVQVPEPFCRAGTEISHPHFSIAPDCEAVIQPPRHARR